MTNGMQRLASAPLVALVVAACAAGPAPSASSVATAAPSAAPTQTTPARTPTRAIVSPSPAVSADVAISPEIPVVYANDSISLWASAFIAGGKTGPSVPLAIATATVNFGDGASGSVSQSCALPAERLQLHHVYRTAAAYTLSVRSATLCEPGWQLYLDSGENIRILPAAAPGTATWPLCTTYQLKMTDGGTGAALGNVATLVRLTNVSGASCNLQGYPDLRLISATGALLPTHVLQATDRAYLFAPMTVGRVALAPGDTAAFEFAYGDNPFGSVVNEPYDIACPPARWLRVILPGDRQYGTASVRTAPCGGLVNVSPIYPGRDPIGP